MSDFTKNANVPVSAGAHKGYVPAAVMQAAAQRIQAVPAGDTLVDQLSDETWVKGEDGNITVGKKTEI